MTSHALKSFWRCYDLLPAHIQKLAGKNFALFKSNPRHPSLGFGKKGAVYSVEIGRSYRALARERTVIITGSGSAHTSNTTVFAFKCFKISVVHSLACDAAAVA